MEKYLASEGLEALGDARGIVERVFPHLGIDPAKIRSATALEGTFNLCNFTRKTAEVIPHQRITMDHLVAGISLPIFMPAVNIVKGVGNYGEMWDRTVAPLGIPRGINNLWNKGGLHYPPPIR